MVSASSGFDEVSASSTSKFITSMGSAEVPQPFWELLREVFLLSLDFLLLVVFMILGGMAATDALIYTACRTEIWKRNKMFSEMTWSNIKGINQVYHLHHMGVKFLMMGFQRNWVFKARKVSQSPVTLPRGMECHEWCQSWSCWEQLTPREEVLSH